MTEVLVLALAVAFPYVVAAPILTLGVGLLLRRWPVGDMGWLLLVTPVLLPVLWLLGGASHLAEPGRVHQHLLGGVCSAPLLYLGLVLAPLVVVGAALWLRPSPQRSWAPLPRVARELCGGRVRLVRGDDLCTRGLLRPRVELGEDLAARLQPAALESALRHELQHVRRHDPLRSLLLEVCLRLNPAAPLLAVAAQRWRDDREEACDREAVASGAGPLDLAEALVQAARPQQRLVPHLGSCELRSLRRRVHLLLGYAESRPRQAWRLGMPLTLLTMAVAPIAPHALDAWPVHGIDHLLHLLLHLFLGTLA